MVEGRSKVICIGGDSRKTIALVQSMVNRDDIEFTAIGGELEGLETIRRVKPDLLLLDAMTQEQILQSRAIYQQIKADNDLKHIPMVILSDRDLGAMMQPGHHN